MLAGLVSSGTAGEDLPSLSPGSGGVLTSRGIPWLVGSLITLSFVLHFI